MPSLPPPRNPASAIYSCRGGETASGEATRPTGLTAAHKTLPFGTMVRVTNRNNGRSVVVCINDHGGECEREYQDG